MVRQKNGAKRKFLWRLFFPRKSVSRRVLKRMEVKKKLTMNLIRTATVLLLFFLFGFLTSTAINPAGKPINQSDKLISPPIPKVSKQKYFFPSHKFGYINIKFPEVNNSLRKNMLIYNVILVYDYKGQI
jgi:hypothetical protein